MLIRLFIILLKIAARPIDTAYICGIIVIVESGGRGQEANEPQGESGNSSSAIDNTILLKGEL